MEKLPTTYLEYDENPGDSPAELSPAIYTRTEAPREMLYAAEAYEKKYGIHFETLSYFSTMLLNELHRSEGDPTKVSENVIVSSLTDKTILKDIDVLSEIVNSPNDPSREERLLYY